ncbi:hypothetical protein BOX15_Mlig026215g1 [Macrostomum lignano]|uniref:Uncharacterized protein n=1 Tax=Macrostomum lignano TaxID=282301 RepID=A0A267DWZ4_9PLAT|nr:hypothetical protein BOX15_Mlig026215g1 [Macrostomum lignano]
MSATIGDQQDSSSNFYYDEAAIDRDLAALASFGLDRDRRIKELLAANTNRSQNNDDNMNTTTDVKPDSSSMTEANSPVNQQQSDEAPSGST